MTNYLEVIEVRASHGNKAIEECLIQTKKELEKQQGVYELTIYKNCYVETDFSIHIHYESQTEIAKDSALGMQLVSAMKEYGLVNHSLWKEDIVEQ